MKVLHYMKDEHIMNTLHYVPSSVTQKIKLITILKVKFGLDSEGETDNNVFTVTKSQKRKHRHSIFNFSNT